MEQLVEERRMEHENINDIFRERGSSEPPHDMKHYPGEGDRPHHLPNGVHHLQEQVSKENTKTNAKYAQTHTNTFTGILAHISNV